MPVDTETSETYPTFSYPELQQYEREEYEARRDEWRARQDKAEISDSESNESFSKTYRLLRFYRSVQGFFTGSLDLTGRHWPRCVSLMTQWIDYISEFREVGLNATPFYYEEADWQGNLQTYVDYNMSDADIWRRFQAKWCIPLSFTYGTCLSWSDQVLDTVIKHSTFKIQKLCLLDLPVELLDNIMSVITSDLSKARLLSSTCRHLRNIGLRYIFGQRTLSIECEPDWKLVQSQANPAPYLRDTALRAQAKLLSTTRFLLSRPDLTRRLRNLFIANGWSPMVLESSWAEGFDITAFEPTFYFPVLRDLGQIFCASDNLGTLTFVGIDIHVDFLRTISQYENLHFLKFRLCQVTQDVQSFIVAGQVPMSQTISNLELIMDAPESWNQWCTLLLYPQLRTLAVRGSSHFSLQSPAESIRQQCNPFQTLQRLHLHHFDLRHVPQLSTWLRAAAVAGPGLRLTHFKLRTKLGMSDFEVFQLLDALQTAPLQALTLDGLQDGEVELIDHIAQTFPNLLGLTLLRRHNDRQSHVRLSMWPHPSWVYAPHFASFNRLCHFGWNFKYSTFDLTPSIMIQFENDFAGCDSTELMSWNEEDLYFLDDHSMALPFAVHCVTLQTFAIVDDFIRMGCWISRTSSGRPRIDDDFHNNFAKNRVLERWNPPFQGWPPVLPARNELSSDT